MYVLNWSMRTSQPTKVSLSLSIKRGNRYSLLGYANSFCRCAILILCWISLHTNFFSCALEIISRSNSLHSSFRSTEICFWIHSSNFTACSFAGSYASRLSRVMGNFIVYVLMHTVGTCQVCDALNLNDGPSYYKYHECARFYWSEDLQPVESE